MGLLTGISLHKGREKFNDNVTGSYVETMNQKNEKRNNN